MKLPHESSHWSDFCHIFTLIGLKHQTSPHFSLVESINDKDKGRKGINPLQVFPEVNEESVSPKTVAP